MTCFFITIVNIIPDASITIFLLYSSIVVEDYNGAKGNAEQTSTETDDNKQNTESEPERHTEVSSNEPIKEFTAKEEFDVERSWRKSLPLNNGEVRLIDMKVIDPYKKVISHGGYMHASLDGHSNDVSSPAIIVFSACYLPDRSRRDYNYVMDNLFMYAIWFLLITVHLTHFDISFANQVCVNHTAQHDC